MYKKDYPAQGGVALDALKSDTVDLTYDIRAIYIGGDGDVKATLVDGTTVTFANMVAGTIYPFRVKRLWSTGTSATGIIGLL